MELPAGWSGNGEKHTGTITFTGDADYTVSYFCYDKAGNKSNTEKLDEITIDKTKPTVAVSYDNQQCKEWQLLSGRTYRNDHDPQSITLMLLV